MNFLNKIDKYASNACLIDDDEKVFLYEDIIKTSEKISEKLKERSLILVLAQNDIEFISGYIGFFRKRLIQMIIDSKIKDEFFIDLIKKYLPSYIFMPILKNTNLKDYQLVFKLKKYKILKLKNLIITPHLAGISENLLKRNIKLIEDNLRRFCFKHKLLNQVNLKEGY